MPFIEKFACEGEDAAIDETEGEDGPRSLIKGWLSLIPMIEVDVAAALALPRARIATEGTELDPVVAAGID